MNLNVSNECMKKYLQYRNMLTKIIGAANLNSHKNTLTQLKNNSRSLWAHLNNMVSPNKILSIPSESNVLNNFFTSVFNQALNLILI